METHVLRLRPGQDLKRELDALANESSWPAACIVTAVGSLRTAAVRFADAEAAGRLDGPLEIIALGGTLSRDGSHIHILVCDRAGVPKGGHLKEGSIVFTTVEIVVAVLPEWDFARVADPHTGCLELKTVRRAGDGPDPGE